MFTGRIVADDWAGRPIKTKHGVRYHALTRPIRLPATVRLVVVEAWQPGTCPKTPKLQEIPDKGDMENLTPPEVTFTARQRGERGEEGVKTLVVREVKSPDFSSLVQEKSFPWPFWPFTHHGRPNIRFHALDIELARPQASMFELQACVAEHCSPMEWPAKHDGDGSL